MGAPNVAYSTYTDIPLSPYQYRPSLDGAKKSPGLLDESWDRRRVSVQVARV